MAVYLLMTVISCAGTEGSSSFGARTWRSEKPYTGCSQKACGVIEPFNLINALPSFFLVFRLCLQTQRCPFPVPHQHSFSRLNKRTVGAATINAGQTSLRFRDFRPSMAWPGFLFFFKVHLAFV